jgi:hypothetical protein
MMDFDSDTGGIELRGKRPVRLLATAPLFQRSANGAPPAFRGCGGNFANLGIEAGIRELRGS